MESAFEMFSAVHISSMITLCLLILLLFICRNRWSIQQKKVQFIERFFALTLFIMDGYYYIWLVQTGRWDFGNSLPLELCSISLIVCIVLLWTGSKRLYPFVFYAGIGGAIQAVATPVLDLNFPHFRFFHFFYTHFGIILTALYFTWVKGYRPTFKGVVQTMITLNVLLPFLFAINILVKGNYMFLQEKPRGGSLLDFLGPYPWYILSLELVAFVVFCCLWLLFKTKKHKETATYDIT
ncbi:TIGR02206 family membrane protein [Psychrobacillus sp. NPDC096623]|uniref:YwaF family protein n=1 Tax=Psychrobacillus sp. NPDC096623 TaxID=3364492 RepID=UPI003818610D